MNRHNSQIRTDIQHVTLAVFQQRQEGKKVVFLFVCLAVAFEPAPRGVVEEGSGELFGFQRLVQPVGAGKMQPLGHTLHYTRDVTFQEDRSRIRHNPGVFARLRSFAYNILRRNKTSTFSQDRYAAALQGLDPLLKWCVS